MSLQFGSFVWPNDPEVFRVRFHREVEQSPTGDGLWALESVNREARIFEGEGVFYGDSAYASFSALALKLYTGSIESLVHPRWESALAILTDLTVEEARGRDLLRYSFRFVEYPAAG